MALRMRGQTSGVARAGKVRGMRDSRFARISSTDRRGARGTGSTRTGVALSGGGYWSSAWGLGALLYLANARLSGGVVTVSSVSGGSIMNAVVGLRSYPGMTPEDLWTPSARLARKLV